MTKKSIAKQEFAELSKVMDPLDIIKKYSVIEESINQTQPEVQIKPTTNVENILPVKEELYSGETLKNSDTAQEKSDYKTTIEQNQKDLAIQRNKITLSNLISTEGRISRLTSFLTEMLLYLSMLILYVIGSGIRIDSQVNILNSVISLFFVVIFFFLCITIFYTTIKRLHDLNLSGWLAFVLLIPYIGVIFGIILRFKRGTIGKNKYGEDPLQVKKL